MFIVGTPHAKGAGYFVNDDTPSGGKKVEGDVRTCMHCQAILIMQKWKDDGGWCGRCNAPICATCADRMDTHGCEPFIAQIEKALKITPRLEQFRKEAGLEKREPARLVISSK